MASIQKRGKTWGYSVSLGLDTLTKKQIQKTRYGFSTKKEAKIAAERLEYTYKVERGRITTKKNEFSQVVEDWLNVYEQAVKPGTLYIRKKALKKALPIWGNQKIDNIDHIAYQSFITALSKKYSRNYVDSIHDTLRLVFKFALRERRIWELPCEDITFKKASNDNNLENFLEKDKLKEFLVLTENTDNYDDFLIFYTLALTGLRIGELMALRWQDIDLKNRTINVNHTIYNPTNNQNNYMLVEPKTQKSKRRIPMADSLVEAFLDYKKYVESKIKKQTKKSFVFFQNENKPLTNTLVRTRLVSILRKWDYQTTITLHSFRHTFASLLIEDGVSVMNVAELLGHSDTTITTKIYTHVTKTRHLEMQSSLSKFASSLKI